MYGDGDTSELETISGIADSIVYQNEENGYVVFEMEDTAGYPVTVTGIIPTLPKATSLRLRENG